jgi:hypothetical protein
MLPVAINSCPVEVLKSPGFQGGIIRFPGRQKILATAISLLLYHDIRENVNFVRGLTGKNLFAGTPHRPGKRAAGVSRRC